MCGGLNGFDTGWRVTAEDLAKIIGSTAADLFYLNSAQPAQFMGLIRWWKSLPDEKQPRVVMEFVSDPGVDVLEIEDNGKLSFRLHDYRIDPKAMFYRFAARHLPVEDLTRFHLITFDDTTSRVFSAVINRPVDVLPLPLGSDFPLRSRVGSRPITVSVLGHQRPDKGYHLMPDIARRLLKSETDIRLLMQNSAPREMPHIQQELRAIAATDARVIIDEQAAGAQRWNLLLRRSDVILCPYEPFRYIASWSAVATDAVANGIPLVVPAETSMARLIMKYGGAGTTFRNQEPGEIAVAASEAIASFDTLAARASEAASQWIATMGAFNTVNELVAYCNRA